MRKLIKDQEVGLDPNFNYRGLNQTRIETFSDAVFAVAFTLVVLSSSVPDTFDELRASIADIVPSFICIVLIVVIWYQHYICFLRYGLQDIRTVVINTFLLFLVLIYIYPLKFLARFLYQLYSGIFTGDMHGFIKDFGGSLSGENMSLLMTAYGLGATLIFLTMAWLYRHAYKRRTELKLTEYELLATKMSLQQNLLMSLPPFLSVVIVSLGLFGSGNTTYIVGGFIYMIYPPLMITFGKISAKRLKAIA